MIGVFFIGILIVIYEWVYLKRRKVRLITYVKVFSTLLLALIYLSWIVTLEEDYVTSPIFYLNKVFIPLQHFLTLKGWRG